MSAWRSRWSCDRLVKIATSNTMPSTRCWSRACDETSSAAACTPPSRIRASSRWRSGASGVVRAIGTGRPSMLAPVVPTTPARPTCGPEDRRQDVRHGGLAVRPGHPDRRHRRGRIAERHRRHGSHRPAHRRDQRLWRIDVEPSVDDERGGSGVQRLGREHVSVGVPSRHAEEECARRDLARIERDVGEGDGGVASDRRSRNGGHQVRERHRGEGGCHRLRAYPRPRSRVGRGHGRPSTWGGGATGGAVGMPRRWIAYRATCWKSGAAATPP